jgi:hypothetical protein
MRQQFAVPPTAQVTHPCPGASGLSTPLVRVTSWDTAHKTARVRLLEREDYVGDAHGLLYDTAGRPIMSVDTERPDGSNDRLVFVPPAPMTADVAEMIRDEQER